MNAFGINWEKLELKPSIDGPPMFRHAISDQNGVRLEILNDLAVIKTLVPESILLEAQMFPTVNAKIDVPAAGYIRALVKFEKADEESENLILFRYTLREGYSRDHYMKAWSVLASLLSALGIRLDKQVMNAIRAN